VDFENAWCSCSPDPDHPGWFVWRIKDKTVFNLVLGDLLARRDGDRAIVRMQPQPGLSNMAGRVHGGALMTFADCSLFAGALMLGCGDGPDSLTIDLNVQFIGAADMDRPVDSIVQISRETRRMLFMRGTIEQGGDIVASYMGLVRKAGK